MDLFSRDIIQVDTRASPTPDGRTADVAFHGLDLFDRMTETRGIPTTRQDDQASTLKVFSTSSPDSTSTDQSASSALAQAAKRSSLSSVAILSIIFGSIVAVVFLILALACWIQASQKQHDERPETHPAHGKGYGDGKTEERGDPVNQPRSDRGVSKE
jgi:hypothetical protein